jgi:hypothetical protein
MNSWKKAWSYCLKNKGSAKFRKELKRFNHRANRRAAKRLENRHIRLNGWDVI